MDEENQEAIEVQEETGEGAGDGEAAHYECAFHILPTVADAEVSGVVDALKTIVTHAGGSITADEVSPRYDLAYEIAKSADGVSRRFNAAHFGWMRFTIAPGALPGAVEELAHRPELLRYLVIRLTRDEVEKPFSIMHLREDTERASEADGEERAAERAGGESPEMQAAESADAA